MKRPTREDAIRYLIAEYGKLPFPPERIAAMAELVVDSAVSPTFDRDLLPHWRDSGYPARNRPGLSLWQLLRGVRDREREERRRVEVDLASAENMRRRKAQRLLNDRQDASERQREAFRLVRIEGLTYQQAADKMEIARQNVAKLLAKFEGGDKPRDSFPEGREGVMAIAPTTADTKLLLENLSFNLEDVSEITNLPPEWLQELADADGLTGFLTDTEPHRIRLAGAGFAMAANEITLLVDGGELTADEACDALALVKPLIPDLLHAAIFTPKAAPDPVITRVNGGGTVTLIFHRRLAVNFLQRLVGMR